MIISLMIVIIIYHCKFWYSIFTLLGLLKEVQQFIAYNLDISDWFEKSDINNIEMWMSWRSQFDMFEWS